MVLSCSVVIPVLDDAKALERCLAAIERQDVPPAEILVVDNGSSDASPAVAVWRGATLLRQPHPGIGAAAGLGYDAAVGDLILRLDSDSAPPADWIARVAEAFAADPGLDALTGPGEFVAVPAALRRMLTGWYWRIYFDGLQGRVGAQPLFGSNLALRSAAWRQVSGSVHRFDRMVHDDLDLTIHLLHADRRIRVDPQLRMPVSVRPLVHPLGMIRRARRAAHTIALHDWTDRSPQTSIGPADWSPSG